MVKTAGPGRRGGTCSPGLGCLTVRRPGRAAAGPAQARPAGRSSSFLTGRSPTIGWPTSFRPGETILVAGVKVATQTPAVRSGQRIIFATLDDAVGLVDLAFFESVQERCAARLFASWLLLVRGTVRRSGAGTRGEPGGVPGRAHARPDAVPVAVTVNGAQCWDIPALDEIRVSQGMPAMRA